MFSLFDDEQILDAYARDLRKDGVKDGKWEKTKEITFKLFRKNRSDEDIIDTLDISPAELQALKSEYATDSTKKDAADLKHFLTDSLVGVLQNEYDEKTIRAERAAVITGENKKALDG